MCYDRRLMDHLGNIPPPTDGLTITERELFGRLGWFTQVRWAMGSLTLLILLASWYLLGVRFHSGAGRPTMAPAVWVIAVLFLYNAAFTVLFYVVRARRQMTRRLIAQMALGQIACDLGIVCALVHYTGGAENLFVILLLLPIVIAAEFLPQWLAYTVAAAAAGMINALAWGEQQGVLTHFHADWGRGARAPGAELHSDPYYVLQLAVAMTLTILAMTVIACNVTSRLRRREAQLEDAYHSLSAADESKSFFMRKAGHEMRAPLAAIYSILDAVTQDCDPASDEKCHLLHRARQRCRGLMDLVDDLRRYSRVRDPQSILHVRRLRLDRVVNGTVELFRTQAAGAGIQLKCRTEQVELNGDEDLLGELVTNLVANAIQYTPSGGTVEVSLAAEGASAVLAVADTGIGLSKEAAEKVFDEFYRAPEAKAAFPEGTGLGLTISRRIVQLHNGEISAAPREGGGTVFTVRLPV